jgi:hypothetical protein
MVLLQGSEACITGSSRGPPNYCGVGVSIHCKGMKSSNTPACFLIRFLNMSTYKVVLAATCTTGFLATQWV